MTSQQLKEMAAEVDAINPADEDGQIIMRNALAALIEHCFFRQQEHEMERGLSR